MFLDRGTAKKIKGRIRPGLEEHCSEDGCATLLQNKTWLFSHLLKCQPRLIAPMDFTLPGGTEVDAAFKRSESSPPSKNCVINFSEAAGKSAPGSVP